MRYLFTVLGLCLITISMQAQNWDWNCDCEIDFTEPFICAADVDGNIVPVPNECFADCLELTVVDSADCLDDGTFGLDSLWFENDCDCEISEDDEPICVLTDSITGIVCPFPNLCFAECAGYSEADVVEEGCDFDWGIDSTFIFFEDCDCEIDPFEEFICVEDSLGNVFPFFNACLADCLGLTVLDSTDCEFDWIWDDNWIFGTDSTDWVWYDCDCDSTAWEGEGICIEFFEMTATGDSLPYVEWVPSECYAECWGYTNYTVVDCDSIWTWNPCDCDPEDWNSEGICIEISENTATGEVYSYVEWVPSECYAECWGYTDFVIVDCDSIWTWTDDCGCDPEAWYSEGVCIELSEGTASGELFTYIEWVPSTCHADCWGLTDYTVVDCDSIWPGGGIDTLIVDWNDCDCEYSDEDEMVCVLTDIATGEICPFPNLCFAECAGYTIDDVVPCDVMMPDCYECFDEPLEPVCVTDSTGIIFPVPNACFADCLGLIIIDDEDCGGLQTSEVPYDRRKDIAFDIPNMNSSNQARSSQTVVSDFNLYPNPVLDNLTIQWIQDRGSVTKLSVSNLSGQLIYTESFARSKGANSTELDASTWISGMYIIRLENDSNTIVKKLFKE